MSIHWIVFISIVVILIQSYFYRSKGLKKVYYDRFFNVKQTFAGEEIELIEKISNHKLLPLPWLRLESSVPAALKFQNQEEMNISSGELYQNHRSLFSLGPYTEIVRRHKVACPARGTYHLSSATLSCGDLFGFQGNSSPLKMNARITVYPKLMELSEIPLSTHSLQGETVVRRWIVNDPFMISGVKEYRAGDTFNQVNWKATARTGNIQVHQYDFTANQRYMLLVNFDVHEEMWTAVTEPELIETGISYAASIAQYTLHHGIETGFGCNGKSIRTPRDPLVISPGLGREYLTHIYEEMAKLIIERTSDFPTFMEREIIHRTKTKTDFLIITAFVSIKMQQYIDQLIKEGHSVNIIPLEMEKGEKQQK